MIAKAAAASAAKVTAAFNEVLSKKDEQIKSLSNEIDRLKSQINKNSSNSSKPPSSNGFKKIIQNNREKTGNKMGGKPGHPGHKLELPANIEELINSGKLERRILHHKENEKIKYTDEYY